MPIALGVDVGGTKIAAALVDLEDGRLLHQVTVPTALVDGAGGVLAGIRRAVTAVRDLGRSDGAEPIGLGLPELVSPEGAIASRWIADWTGLDPRRELADLGIVAVDSDVRLATLAEQRYGHGRDFASFAFITAGTGLSYSHCSDGRIHRGAHGFAIHFASNDLMVMADGRQAAFNLESFASGLGMAQAYARRTGRTASARDIVEGRAGAEGALLLDQATTALASYVGQMINMLDPQAVVLGGGLGTAPAFFEAVRAKVPAYVWAEACRTLPIRASALHATAGVVGAAALHAPSPSGPNQPWPPSA
ncbi:ROK family protein [Labrys wisconsinensis]|uniref:Glucokinase n=1 Tax=Labrys wisconsinensis TaxID=425677 RepID=A0ABU0J0W6_9HYPH|nr:ROK family protein [Labrys wisconsinensis]MDQ0467900.1 glucokinase [Labrys wisconsinensis]